MNVIVFVYLLSEMIGFGVSYNCEDKINEETDYYDPPLERYNHNKDYYEIVHSETFTANSIIECSNINSLGQITYNYVEQKYDQFLKISNSNLSQIHSLELYRFTTIAKIYLSNCHIQEINPGAFTGLTNLTELYLNNNELTEIVYGVFNNLETLKILDLSYNKIYQIDFSALDNILYLQNLFLNNNNLTELNLNFENIAQINVLNLAENPLEKLGFNNSDLTISSLLLNNTFIEEIDDSLNINCNFLNLTNCKLSQVNFEYLPQSYRIDLSQNKIILIENCEISNVFELNLKNNQIAKINCAFNQIQEINLSYNQLKILENPIFVYPEFVVSLDLSHNLLMNFSNNFFYDLKSLQDLKLNNNNLNNIPTDLFKDLSHLKNLDLSNNQLKQFSFGVFDNLENLQVLNVSKNQLSSLHQLTLHSLRNLHKLSFDDNQISVVDVTSLMEHLPRLKLISLNYNPWNCENLIEIYKKLNNIRTTVLTGNVYNVENVYGVACKNSKKLDIVKNTSDLSYQEVANKMQKAINEGIENSNLDFFFNNFQQSKFVQFFAEDYKQSNFFKYLNNLKFMLTREENSNTTKSEKFTAIETVSEKSSNASLIFNNVLLILIAFMLFSIIYLIFKFVKPSRSTRIETTSELELC